MMKKKVWLVLLAVVLVSGLVMFGCGGSKEDDGGKKPGGGDEIKNPVADGAKFFKITKRTSDYFTLDIKAGKDASNPFAAGKAHTITVYGNAKSGSDCMFANTDDPWAEKTPKVKSDADGMFTIEREFSAAELADTAQNIRIKIQQTVDFYIYEITIVDEDDTAVFTMSTDAEIQGLPSGNYFTTDAEATKWLKRAGTPTITVMVPGESEGEKEPCECDGDKTKCECGTDCDCPECELVLPPANGTKMIVKLGATPQDCTVVPGNNGTIGYADDNSGFTYTYGTAENSNYGNGIVRFKVALGTKTLGDYEKVTFTWTGIEGDVISHKRFYLLASATEAAITPHQTDDNIKALVVSSLDPKAFYDGDGPQMNGTAPINSEVSILKGESLSGDVWFSFYTGTTGGSYSIGNVVFVEKE